MRVLENLGRFVSVEEDGGDRVVAERVDPRVVVVDVVAETKHSARASLGEDAGMAFLRGLAALYGCRVVETEL